MFGRPSHLILGIKVARNVPTQAGGPFADRDLSGHESPGQEPPGQESSDHVSFQPSQLDAAMIKAQLRKQMRAARRRVDSIARESAANALVEHALASDWFTSGMHIAAYWAAGSELSLKPLLELLLARGVFVYLPQVESNGAMRFVRYRGPAWLLPGQYGICEPISHPSDSHADQAFAPSIEIILMPLLAFDAHGHRLGQGGGYYDRYLRNLDSATPLRVGIAFHFQAVEYVPIEQFDEKLHAVITERAVLRF